MRKEIDIKLNPDQVEDLELVLSKACSKARINQHKVKHWEILRKSIDARFGRPQYVLRIAIDLEIVPKQEATIKSTYKDVHNSDKVIIVGAGPAGYYAALELL